MNDLFFFDPNRVEDFTSAGAFLVATALTLAVYAFAVTVGVLLAFRALG